MKTTVINLRGEDPNSYTYIGRGSKWGNPYTHLKGKTKAQFQVIDREESIEKYEEWIRQQPNLINDLHELKGKRLGCYCVPYYHCHGEVLVKLIEEFCLDNKRTEDIEKDDFWNDF